MMAGPLPGRGRRRQSNDHALQLSDNAARAAAEIKRRTGENAAAPAERCAMARRCGPRTNQNVEPVARG